MRHWYHIDCLFESFTKQRATTKKIESASDIFGWETLNADVQDRILQKIQQSGGSGERPKAKEKSKNASSPQGPVPDDSLAEFTKICNKVANVSSYTDKTRIVEQFLKSGTDKKKFQGDTFLWIKFLLPMTEKRVYNLQSKQLVKLFARIFDVSHQEMLTDLELGDVSETVEKFFKRSKSSYKPLKETVLYLQDVEEFLKKLTFVSKEDEQIELFQTIVKRCTEEDLKTIIRLIKHDLRINAGPKHILEALSKDAYTMYQNSRNLKEVVDKFTSPSAGGSPQKKTGASKKGDDLELKIMTPIMPMLAAPCKDLDKALAKCPGGMYSEIKYDGERVQIHKQGNDFNFYSRSLKPVMDHKIKSFKEYVPEAFPNVNELILDAEVIMVDTKTGDLLPFGTLGIHKKNSYAGEAQNCLFIFDCLYLDGENLTKKPLDERRKILMKVLKPIKNRIQLSESKLLTTKDELLKMVSYVLKQGLEGLVLKKSDGIYEPNKRHWWKIKKDYLCDGSLADSADLVVLGAWFGTGNMGGLLSIFLMGCYDEDTKVWKTVTKAHSGLDHAMINDLQRWKDEMIRPDVKRLPHWFSCQKSMVPDMVAKDPHKMPVFEIVGAEFSKTEGAHTADGISIRFPRVAKIRDDKEAKDATTMQELRYLYKVYKENTDLDLARLVGGSSSASSSSAGGTASGTSKKTPTPDTSLLTKYFSPKKKEASSTESSRGKKRASSASPKVEDEEEAVEKKKKSHKKAKVEDLVFRGVVVHIPEEVKKQLPKDVLEEFLLGGGETRPDPKGASHVLHSKDVVQGDLNELR